MKNKIYPCWWFDNNGAEAVDFYMNIFPQSRITADTGMVISFELWDNKFMALNAGPHFTKNPSISFFVSCDTAEAVEQLWEKLSGGGQVLMPLDTYPWSAKYGWVTDRYGVSWQVYQGQPENIRQRISPSLMFTGSQAGNARKAIGLYTSIFDNSKTGGIRNYEKDEGDREGYVKHAEFLLQDQLFMAMDSSQAHAFSFNEGISLVVDCETQEEIDHLWDNLTANGGEESKCGWLKDPFGVSWQIVPAGLGKWMTDPEKAKKVMDVVLRSKKLIIAELEQAAS